jgi:hypothetical protein
MGADIHLIFISVKAKYFSSRALTGIPKATRRANQFVEPIELMRKSARTSFLMSTAATHVVWIGTVRSIARPAVRQKTRIFTAASRPANATTD